MLSRGSSTGERPERARSRRRRDQRGPSGEKGRRWRASRRKGKGGTEGESPAGQERGTHATGRLQEKAGGARRWERM